MQIESMVDCGGTTDHHAQPQKFQTAFDPLTQDHGSVNLIPIRPDLTDIKRAVGEAGYLGWLELDRVLAQLHESCSIRPKIIVWGDRQRVGSCMEYLLPQAVVGGIVDLEDPTW